MHTVFNFTYFSLSFFSFSFLFFYSYALSISFSMCQMKYYQRHFLVRQTSKQKLGAARKFRHTYYTKKNKTLFQLCLAFLSHNNKKKTNVELKHCGTCTKQLTCMDVAVRNIIEIIDEKVLHVLALSLLLLFSYTITLFIYG